MIASLFKNIKKKHEYGSSDNERCHNVTWVIVRI
jgi:hypothetical protein